MIHHAARLVVSVLLTAVLAGSAGAQTDGAESKIARIRLDHPGTQIYQVFIDRKPMTILYRKGIEVGIEITAEDSDGVACRHDVAVVTTDGRLANRPGVDFCAAEWIVAIDASSLSGGETGADTADVVPDTAPDVAQDATRDAAPDAAPAEAQTVPEPDRQDSDDGAETAAQADSVPEDAEPDAAEQAAPQDRDGAEAEREPAAEQDQRDADARPEPEQRSGQADPAGARRDAPEIDGCGWFAILTCRREEAAAARESTRITGGDSVIATDDYRGLQPGYYCVAEGPYPGEDEAAKVADSFRDGGAPDAYAKRACEAGVVADTAAPPSTDEPADGESETRAETAAEADADRAPAPAGAAPGWSFAHPDADAASQATLTYVDPDSRTVEMAATCSPGSGEVSVSIGRAPQDIEPDDPVNVVLATEDFRQRYEAVVGEADAGPSVGFTAAARDPLWAALAGDLRLSLELGTLDAYTISLRGSAAPVRGFAATCAAASPPVPAAPPVEEEAGEPADAGEAGDLPAGDRPATALPGLPAARYVCSGGPGLEVLFDVRGRRAIVSVDGDRPMVLFQEGPEARFAGEGFELLTLGPRAAAWVEPDGASYECRIR